MSKETLLIHNNPTLYDILFELKNFHNFNLKKINNEIIDRKNIDKLDLIISKNQFKISRQITLGSDPIELNKLIDIINLNFLKIKIENQKDIKIGKYLVNFNNRKISLEEKNFNLTEKETKIIEFLHKSKNPVSINQLQKSVWGYKSQLETHTVETHVYRLRKKILKIFNDNNFIKSKKSGYCI